MSNKRFTLRWGDVCVIAAVIALSVGAMWYASSLAGGDGPLVAVVTAGGEVLCRENLSALQEPATLAVESGGHRLSIALERGRARVAASTCEDQVCVRMGWLARGGATAACAPAQLSLRLEGGAGERVDAVVR